MNIKIKFFNSSFWWGRFQGPGVDMEGLGNKRGLGAWCVIPKDSRKNKNKILNFILENKKVISYMAAWFLNSKFIKQNSQYWVCETCS